MSDANFSESLDEDVLFDEEQPDRDGDLGQLVDPGDEAGIDDEADAVAMEDREDDPSGVDRAPQDQGEMQPAEEAAMHLTDEPPMGDGDGYVD
ncbi:MAG TPA: hypothetical protein VFU93_14435 [Acidimicrobiales bacterium]|nr:hypothetical protein [Acidimicrobiales bacterium]